jgi:hypothetical protein
MPDGSPADDTCQRGQEVELPRYGVEELRVSTVAAHPNATLSIGLRHRDPRTVGALGVVLRAGLGQEPEMQTTLS